MRVPSQLTRHFTELQQDPAAMARDRSAKARDRGSPGQRDVLLAGRGRLASFTARCNDVNRMRATHTRAHKRLSEIPIGIAE